MEYLRPRILVALVLGSIAVWVQPAQSQLQLTPAFPLLSFNSPVDLHHAGDGSNRLFVVEQDGVIRVFDNNPVQTAAPVFLDIRGRVTSGGETGLLGLAFHPNYAANGFFFVYYTAPSPLRSVIARYEVDPANPDLGNPDSELILLEVSQSFGNHNAGQIAFGPDGYLYIALGDGGSGGDPQEHGQNPGTLLGSMLRIDIDGESEQSPMLVPDCGAGPNATYTIPADNPLADGPGGDCDEIWAYGLRNPWRFSFDSVTGMLWAADVGQDDYEEVDIVTAGGNYGWNTMEGLHCFDPPVGCNQAGLTLPVWEYPHNGQAKSVTGGYVYRGTIAPTLLGQYIYADYIDGRIWALDDNAGLPVNTLLFDTSLNISTFGVDQDQELYVVAIDGTIYWFSVTRYVAPTGNDAGNNCTDANNPCLTIAHAVDQANPGETLHIASGTYAEPGLVIDKRLRVLGQGIVVD